MLTFGSLFAGVGGFDLGFEKAGWECRWQVEWDARCRSVLALHWPDVARYGDVRDVTAKSNWRLTEDEKRRACDLYRAGLSCGQIAEFYGVTRQSMWDVLRRRVTMRPRERSGSANHFYRGGTTPKDRAHNLIEAALRDGILERPELCDECGTSPPPFKDGRNPIQAHHPDYNDPLRVMWLCQPCHHDWHKRHQAVPFRGGDAKEVVEPVDAVLFGFP